MIPDDVQVPEAKVCGDMQCMTSHCILSCDPLFITYMITLLFLDTG